VRDIKANSSKFINEKGWVLGKFAWQTGFGAFTIGQSQIPKPLITSNNKKRIIKRLPSVKNISIFSRPTRSISKQNISLMNFDSESGKLTFSPARAEALGNGRFWSSALKGRPGPFKIDNRSPIFAGPGGYF
jgi:hypothetical protein